MDMVTVYLYGILIQISTWKFLKDETPFWLDWGVHSTDWNNLNCLSEYLVSQGYMNTN